MKLKVSELEGRRLDFWVYRALGWEYTGEIPASWRCGGKTPLTKDGMCLCFDCDSHRFSEYWSDGGPIIEKEGIAIRPHTSTNGVVESWRAGWQWPCDTKEQARNDYLGRTPLVAAMRAFVASKFGDEVVTP